jgi:hypothetical protein
MGTNVFQGCSALINIVTNVYISNFNAAFLTSNNVGLSITFNYIGPIPQGCCNGFNNLESVILGNGISSISNNAFQSCSALTSIIIPNSVVSIDTYAFQGCNSLTSIIIPSSVLSISSEAFYNCTALTSVTFNGNIPSIGYNNFNTPGNTAYYYKGATNVNILSSFFTYVVEINS